MNKFELFCMIFYVLDANWDDTNDTVVGEYLSSANPFLFEDIGSANPSVFIHFCEIIDEDITVENSYMLAQKYICSLNSERIMKAFSTVSNSEWLDSVADYLSYAHKGGDNC